MAWERDRVKAMRGADRMGEKFDDSDTRGGYAKIGADRSNALAEVARVRGNRAWEETGRTGSDMGDDHVR